MKKTKAEKNDSSYSKGQVRQQTTNKTQAILIPGFESGKGLVLEIKVLGLCLWYLWWLGGGWVRNLSVQGAKYPVQ